MYSLSNMRMVANHFSKHPDTNFKEWMEEKFPTKENEDDIKSLMDVWKECKKLPQPRRIDAPLKKIIGKAIQETSIEELMTATRNYVKVIESDYQLSYIWDARKFFSQKNAYPDFMDDGSKWLNYKINMDTALYRWSMLEDGHHKKEALMSRLRKYIAKFREVTVVTINGDFDKNVLEIRKKLALDSMLTKNYPAIFATAAAEENIIVNSPIRIPTTNKTFTVSYDHVSEYMPGNDKPVMRYPFKPVFDALELT